MLPIRDIIAKARQLKLMVSPVHSAYILNYEAGAVARCAQYAALRSGDEAIGFKAHLATELSDLIMQARIVAELHDMHWEDLIKMGEAKIMERADFKDGPSVPELIAADLGFYNVPPDVSRANFIRQRSTRDGD